MEQKKKIHAEMQACERHFHCCEANAIDSCGSLWQEDGDIAAVITQWQTSEPVPVPENITVITPVQGIKRNWPVEVGKDHEHIHNTGSRFKLFILQKD
jgi:hypothetical protein